MVSTDYITEADVLEHVRQGGQKLRQTYPKLYGFLGGLAGTAPDEFDGSVLDPISKDVQAGAAYGYPLGTAVGIAPIAGGIATAKGVATGGRAAQKGMLRLGGRQDLIASHQAATSALLQDSGQLIPELNHVALAVTKDTIPHILANSADTSTLLIPRAGKFDPRTAPTALHTKDAYTARFDDSFVNKLLESGDNIPRNMLAQARQADRYQTRWPQGGAGMEETVGSADMLVGASRFNSFKGFENSAQGAALLKPGKQSIETGNMISALYSKAEDLGVPPGQLLRQIMQSSEQTFEGFDKYKLYQALRTAPRPYAEVKSFGPTQLTGDTFAGALLMPKSAAMSAVDIAQRDAVVRQLAQRGIPVVPRSPSSQVNFTRASNLQKAAR